MLWELSHRSTQAFLLGNAQTECNIIVPTCGLRLTGRSTWNDSFRAKFPVTDSVQTRQEACAVPRNYPVEPLGVRHSERTPVETALPTDTSLVSAKRVGEAGNPTRSERVSASRVGYFTAPPRRHTQLMSRVPGPHPASTMVSRPSASETRRSNSSTADRLTSTRR